MSEPTKGLPDEEFLKQWASDYAKSEHNKGYIDSMAAEILRLRAELAKASAERDAAVAESRRQDTDLSTELSMANAEILRLRAELAKASGKFKWGDCTYEIATVGWGDGSDMPNRVFILRTHANGLDDMLSYKEPFQSDAEVVRLKGELAKASAEVQRLERERGQFGPCSDGWTYSIGSIAWGKTIESPSRVSLSRKHVDGRREELFDFVPQQGSSPVVKMGGIVAKAGDEIVGSVEFRGDYDPEQDAPPADVLGEAFRKAMNNLRPDGVYDAIDELAQVVERIARAQRGGK